MYADAYIELFGNVTRPPEISQAGESRVCSFSVAVSTGKRDDEQRFVSDFYRISVFGEDSIEYVMKNIAVGVRIRVVGSLMMKAYVSKKTGLPCADPRVTAFDIKIVSRPKPKEEDEQHDGKADEQA